MEKIAKIVRHLKGKLLWYALLSIGVGWMLGILFPAFVTGNKKLLSTLITVFVFMMIYPMMINMNLENIPGIIKKAKAKISGSWL